MEISINTEDKTIEIKVDKTTTAEDLVKNVKHTLSDKIDDYKIKSIK